ncbi:MAG: hypothetical protein JKY99_03685 [Rhizobiales bacterium]|nr:hypothetical protein [Hyphomicrobiales bacterium]
MIRAGAFDVALCGFVKTSEVPNFKLDKSLNGHFLQLERCSRTNKKHLSAEVEEKLLAGPLASLPLVIRHELFDSGGKPMFADETTPCRFHEIR